MTLRHVHFGSLTLVELWMRGRQNYGAFVDTFGNYLNLPLDEVFIV
jgi:hypothetical protein